MTMPLSYAFQPQPPPHPKTSGGKRGPSAPISIPSSNEDEDSDHSITDFSPPVPPRLIASESVSSPNSKSSILPPANLPSPRGHITNKKPPLYSPRSLTTSNLNTSNTNSGSNSNVYNLNLLSTNNNHNSNSSSVSSIYNNDVICPTKTNSGTTQGLSSTNTNLNNVNSTLTSSTSLQKSHPPSISIPSSTNNSSIPSISNSALSPTIATQTSNSNVNNNSSSSYDSSKENNCPSSSPRNRSCSPSSTFAYEHDHDYDNVASPCSSTASGPIYVRQPGFQHHAHEVVSTNKVKKKKTSSNTIDLREGLKKREPTPPKLKPKRGTLPMKLRALPQSFWQQPNVAHQVSPATMFPILPPLCKQEEEAMEERPITPPEDKESGKRIAERKITYANTDLLFKLFDGIGEEKKSSQSKSKQFNRQKKSVTKSNTKGLFMGKDPFLMEDVTEKIFPQLTLEGSKHSLGGNTSLQLVTLREGDKTVTFPSLSNDQNYPQMLSELVMHI